MKIRAFVACPVSTAAREAMAAAQSELRAADADVKWDGPEKFHVTVKFLGDVEESTLAKLHQDLRQSLGTIPPFDLTYSGVGGFPDVEYPRVVWIGAERNETLQRLQTEVENAAAAHGFPREQRPFHAHITLGRVKSPRNLSRLTAILKSSTFTPLLVRCTEVLIIRSELKPAGSVYTRLYTIPLAS